MRSIAALVFSASIAFCAPALAQFPKMPDVPGATSAPVAPPAISAEQSALQASIRKLNAYVELLNRTLRASDSLSRYQSWVNPKTGPTGRERIIYGLYSLYDTRGEITKATAALTEQPLMPDLDAAMKDYIAAYSALAPIINEADGYYERQDYKVDKMAEGKAIHKRLVEAAGPYLRERARVDELFAREKKQADLLQLAAIEKAEGRKARWHVRNVMNNARDIVDLIPDGKKPVVDMKIFDVSMATYAAAVKEMDTYAAANPNSFFVFESQPRSLLGKLREFRDKLARAKGDIRKARGSDLTWIVNDYNMMISSSQSATQFNK